MDNQHRAIAGYRDLTPEEVDAMNGLKAKEAELGELLAALDLAVAGDPAAGRWAGLARTHLETGFMFAIKAIARPTNGLGRR